MKRMLIFLVMLGMLTMAFGQVMTTNWQYSVNDGNIPEWFTTDNDDHRGFAYHDGQVYLASWRSRGIIIVDAASGDSIGLVNNSKTGIADVEVSQDGVIFGTNLAESNSEWVPPEMTMYMWSDSNATREIAFTFMPDTNQVPNYRLGDKFTVTGSYTDGTLEIYAANGYWTGNQVYKWHMDGDTINHTPEKINIADVSKLDRQAIAQPLEGSDEFFLSGNGQPIRHVAADGTVLNSFSTGVVSDGNAFDYFETKGRKFIVQNVIWSGQNAQVVEYTDGIDNAIRHWGLGTPTLGPSGNNVNMTGDVDVTVNEDGTVDFFLLMTDNGFASYHLAVPTPPEEPVNMTSNWEISGGERSYFPSSGDLVRGLGYDPVTNSVLIASRQDNKIHLLNAEDGTDVGTLDMTGVEGGFYGISLMKAVADENGVIYACNLASGGDFKIYRWADTSATPTVALQQTVSDRFGDVLAIHGSGTDTKLYASARKGTQIKVFGTTDGENFNELHSIPITSSAADGGISVVNDSTLWINASLKAVKKIDTSGNVLATPSGIEDYYGNVLYMEGAHGEKLLGFNANNSEGNRRKIAVYDITEDESNPQFWASGEMGVVEKPNINVAGNIKYKLNQDNTIDVFQMATNNGIASWNLQVPSYEKDLTIKFEDDSDVSNWGNHNESSMWTSFAHDAEQEALHMTDAGWGFLAKRPIEATMGANFRLSLSAKVAAWGHETNELMVTVEGLGTQSDTVAITDFDHFKAINLEGVADTSTSGYIKIWGMNNGTQSEVYVDHIYFNDNAEDAQLAIVDTTLNFGKTAFNSNKTMSLMAFNKGSENLLLKSIMLTSPREDEWEVSLEDDIIAPGDTTTLTVAFNPENTDTNDARALLVTNGGAATIHMTGHGYELWPLDWRMIAGDPGTDWFWTESLQNYCRGVGYNPHTNHIYVVSQLGGPHIYILDPNDGELIGELDNTGIAQNGATYHVDKVDVTEDGQIIVGSLGRTPDKFNIYHYESETAKPEMVFNQDVGIVAGADLSVEGTGDELTIYSAGYWSSNDEEINKMVVISQDGDTWNSSIVDLPEPKAASYGITATGNGYIFGNGPGVPPRYMKTDGTVIHTFDTGVVPSGTSVEYFEVETPDSVRRFLGITNGWSSGVYVLELKGEPGDSLCANYELMDASTEDYQFRQNLNATAQSVYNSYNNSIVELVTNNGITSYSFEKIVENPVTMEMPLVSVESRDNDLGNLVGTSATVNYTVYNNGSEVLYIDSVKSSAAYLTTNLMSDTIAANSSQEYEFTFDPAGLSGENSAELKLYTNAGLDFVRATANCVDIKGSAIDEDFAAWESYAGHGWSGSNVTLRTDGYGHGDDNYIGPSNDSLDKPITILTPKLVNPTQVVFYYAEYSGGSDSWTMNVVLSEDGETWTDTLGTYNAPGDFDFHIASHQIEQSGNFHIGFVISGEVSGGAFLDDIMIDGDGRWIVGDPINQNFASWTSYDGHQWSGDNVTLRTDGYGHGDDNYIGPPDDGLSTAHTILSPKLQNPTHIAFYYGIYNTSDSWTANVMLTEDGETWADTLGTLESPSTFDWYYTDYPIEMSGNYHIAIVVKGAISGGIFVDDFKANADGIITGIEEENLPIEFKLSQNYPNPFNPTTSIKLALPKRTHVKLTVYNLLGQKVATIRDKEMKAGYHNILFDASQLSSGIYFYRIKADKYNDVKKMTILK
jgi:hypothetical protein